jgi:hypothetical protein
MPRTRLGDLAVKRGFASEPEVETALDFQRHYEPSADRPSAQVGKILVEMGALTEETLAALLEEQAKLAQEGSGEAVGRLVVESTGPVTVNGRPVLASRALVPGDEIRAGEALLRYDGAPILLVAAAAPAEGVLGKVSGAAKKFLPRKKAAGAIGSTLKGAASRTGTTMLKLFKNVTKKRYKNKAEAVRRRDELLAKIGRSELAAGVQGPDAEAAHRAQKALDDAEHTTSIRGSATSQDEVSAMRTAIKAAREQLDLALVRLGWQAIREGRAPAGLDEAVAEIRAIDEAFANG